MTRPGYKMTETGEIPEEWDILPLTKVAKYINGMAFKPSDWKKQGIPIVRIENLNDSSAPFNYFDEEVDNKFLLNDGDILLSWSASLGVYIWNRGKAVLNQHIFKVVPNETVNKYYLFWALHNSVETLSKVTHGSTMKHFQKGELERTKIALPSLSEQQKIAEILSTADETIQKANEEITLTEKLKKGLMQTLLTKGIGHTKFKMIEIGEIPEEWKVMNISDVTIEHKQGLYTNESYTDNGIKLVRITDLLNPNISYETMPFLNVNQKTYEQFKIEKGDFLIARSGAIGRYGIVNDVIHSVFGSYIIRYKFDSSRIDVKFFGYVYSSKHVLGALLKLKHGATNININADNIDGIKIPLPPLSEQQKIAEILSTVDQKLELLRNKKTHLEELKKGLMEDLLTGRVRVKV